MQICNGIIHHFKILYEISTELWWNISEMKFCITVKGQKTTISSSSISWGVPISFLPKILFQLSFWLTFVLKHCLSLHNSYCYFPLFLSCCSQIFYIFFKSLNLLFKMINVCLTKLFFNLLLVCKLLLKFFLQMLCIPHLLSLDMC